MTADVQRELAEALTQLWERGAPFVVEQGGNRIDFDRYAAALLPTVQALIADAEKRAAARALEPFVVLAAEYAERAESVKDGFWKRHLWIVSQRLRAALDPSGAAEGAGR